MLWMALPASFSSRRTGQVTALLLELPPEDAQLAAALMTGELLPMSLGDECAVVVKQRRVQLAELFDHASVRGAVEFGECRPFPKGQIQPCAVTRVLE